MTVSSTLRAGPREWVGLAVLTLPTVLLGLDLTVLYLALPELSTDLKPSATESLWIMDTYGFLIAGFLITMGTVGDRIGRRRLLLIGAAAFGIASVVAAYATSPPMLIAARAVLGVAGATLMPSTLALISNMFRDVAQRALAIGVWATAFAGGMAAGPLVGGVVLDHFWWGAAFLLAVPLIVLVLGVAPILLPEYRAPTRGRLDLPSVALSLAAMLPMVYVLKHVADAGPDPSAGLALLLGTASAVLFVRRQRRLADPLVDLELFRVRAFTAALAVLLVGLLAVGGIMFPVTQYLQLVAGLPPARAGLWMGPPALLMLLAAIGAPLVARRVRPGVVVGVTLLLASFGYLLLATARPEDGLLPIVAGFGLAYLGLGAIAALGTDLVVGTAPPARAGSAAALSETVQELGIAIGVATLGSLVGVIYRSGVTDRLPAGLPTGVRADATDGLTGAASVSDRLPAEAWSGAQQAFASGLNVAAAIAGVAVVALALISMLALRGVGTIGDQEPPDSDDRAISDRPTGHRADSDTGDDAAEPAAIAYPGGSRRPG